MPRLDNGCCRSGRAAWTPRSAVESPALPAQSFPAGQILPGSRLILHDWHSLKPKKRLSAEGGRAHQLVLSAFTASIYSGMRDTFPISSSINNTCSLAAPSSGPDKAAAPADVAAGLRQRGRNETHPNDSPLPLAGGGVSARRTAAFSGGRSSVIVLHTVRRSTRP